MNQNGLRPFFPISVSKHEVSFQILLLASARCSGMVLAWLLDHGGGPIGGVPLEIDRFMFQSCYRILLSIAERKKP